jgi:hypothetical protein
LVTILCESCGDELGIAARAQYEETPDGEWGCFVSITVRCDSEEEQAAVAEHNRLHKQMTSSIPTEWLRSIEQRGGRASPYRRIFEYPQGLRSALAVWCPSEDLDGNLTPRDVAGKLNQADQDRRAVLRVRVHKRPG